MKINIFNRLYAFKVFIQAGCLLWLLSCQKATYQAVYPTLGDGRYDSEFPYRNCSNELDNISRSVKKLFCLVEYDYYDFSESDHVTISNLRTREFKKIAVSKGFSSESVHGTATVTSNDDGNITVLTCAHVIDYADTVITYFTDELKRATEVIQRVAIKRKQVNFIRDLPGEGILEVIFADKEADVAFLGLKADANDKALVNVFGYPTGVAADLEWGSFVYILGYPAGHQMVTRGIVGNPHPGKKDEFLVDALFNTGASGGVVLAVRDGVPNFELVGIAKSVSAKYKNVLKPEKESHEESYIPNQPYSGDIYVKLEKEINYGVTFVITIEAIRELYIKNRNLFINQGYSMDDFFKIP